MNNIKDEWQTPKDLFKYLNETYGPFFWDACCNKSNCLVKTQYPTKNYNYLTCDIVKEVKTYSAKVDTFFAIFMNPPYSNPGPFIAKAWEDSKDFKIVILVPTSILSAKYLDILDKGNEFEREWKKGVTIVPLRRRTKFVHKSLKQSSPPGGCMLIILDRRNEN